MQRRLLFLLALVVALPIVILTALFAIAWRNAPGCRPAGFRDVHYVDCG